MRQRVQSLCSVMIGLVVTALIWFLLITIVRASIPLCGLLLVSNSTKFLCSCTSIQPKTFRVLALAFLMIV